MAYSALSELKPDIKAKFALGHSLGEFSALAINGAFSFLEATMLVHKRGLFMQEDCAKVEAGMMVILGLDDKKWKSFVKKLEMRIKKFLQLIITAMDKSLWQV